MTKTTAAFIEGFHSSRDAELSYDSYTNDGQDWVRGHNASIYGLDEGDKLFTTGDQGYLLYCGNGSARAYGRKSDGSYILLRDTVALSEVQLIRWHFLRAENLRQNKSTAIVRMDCRS